MDTVYYFQLDQALNEVGAAIPVSLLPDGSADLSKLPDGVRKHLAAFGVPDALHKGRLLPKDGADFLDGLLSLNGPYWRFRETPDALA